MITFDVKILRVAEGSLMRQFSCEHTLKSSDPFSKAAILGLGDIRNVHKTSFPKGQNPKYVFGHYGNGEHVAGASIYYLIARYCRGR